MAGRSFRSSPGRVTDESLLVELASLTPEERLRWNDRMVTAVLELRDGFVRLETLADLKRGATGAKERLVLEILDETIRRRGR
jgi:hypothetical protein